jgi:hypothetical protein
MIGIINLRIYTKLSRKVIDEELAPTNGKGISMAKQLKCNA